MELVLNMTDKEIKNQIDFVIDNISSEEAFTKRMEGYYTLSKLCNVMHSYLVIGTLLRAYCSRGDMLYTFERDIALNTLKTMLSEMKDKLSARQYVRIKKEVSYDIVNNSN